MPCNRIDRLTLRMYPFAKIDAQGRENGRIAGFTNSPISV